MRAPSRSMLVSRISPAPRRTHSRAHATASSPVRVRPPCVYTSHDDLVAEGSDAAGEALVAGAAPSGGMVKLGGGPLGRAAVALRSAEGAPPLRVDRHDHALRPE